LVLARSLSFKPYLTTLPDKKYLGRPNNEDLNPEMAILEMIDKISDAIDNKYYSLGVCVFIDLSKAFDTLDHNILLRKLEYYGIRGTALMWLKSYLQNHSQFVAYNGHNYIKLSLTCGVPQGFSILGPLLFLIYINNIARYITTDFICR